MSLTLLSDYDYFGASVKGSSHVQNKLPNQDSFLIKKYKDCSILVVSDGVGSKINSDIGSKAICKAVTASFREYFKYYKKANIRSLLNLIHTRWLLEISPFSPEQCGATVLFAAYSSDRELILGRLGDGMVCYSENGKNYFMDEDKSDSFSNITDCLRENFKFESFAISYFKNSVPDYILLCTDGISDDIKQSTKIEFCKSFSYEYQKIEKVTRTHEIKKMLSKWPVSGNTDDKTIVCMVHK